MGGSAFVKDQCLPHANPFEAGSVDDLITASGFPEPGRRRSVSARAGRILLVLVTEEVPLILWG